MFRAVVDTIRDAGKLGVVLFQFPPWFMPGRDSYAHVDECRERMAGYPVAVELRNRFWLQDEGLEQTLSYLRRSEISFVSVDEPQGFNSSVPPVADVTGQFGIVRFHGRNRDTWEKKWLKKSAERFDYYYTGGGDGGVGAEDRDDAVECRRGARDHEHQQPGPGDSQLQARGEGLRRESRPKSQIVVTDCAPHGPKGTL